MRSPTRPTCQDRKDKFVFQPAVPVNKVLEGVHDRTYVLPAIQREFVWSPDQIRALFDSVMRGYPIGSFLFWKVDAAHAGDFTFYEFISDYHEKNHPYAPVTHIPAGHGVTAILDGQQRLTALNIGLYGSHAERQPRKWWNNPDAFPTKRLYLSLGGAAEDDETELDMVYNFRFLTDLEAKGAPDEPNYWFRVGDVLKLANAGPAIMATLEQRNLAGTDPFQLVYDLYHAVRERPTINAYLEESQDANKVLQIFVRVNSGGTTLSYSDLLLSMATNQWKELDARDQVRTLVQELNNTPATFTFSKDLILKVGLILIDVPDIGFKVSNFTQANMAAMEKDWMAIRSTLIRSADLVASFGFTGRTLTADSALIPIAYYLHHHKTAPNYVTSSAGATDRATIRLWLTRSLMKRGIWGSGLDTLLNRLREAVRDAGHDGFPIQAIEAAMAAIGKSLMFEDAEIAELLDLRYGGPRTYPVLANLYPGLDLTKSFHEDHIFPRSRFTRTRLAAAGVDTAQIDEFIAKADGLPNLQLLAGSPNIEKQAILPAAWLQGPHFASPEQRATYVSENDLQGIPDDITGFLEFFDQRRDLLEQRLRAVLGAL